MRVYDLIVVGAGMAGLTAGALAAADGLSVLVLEAHSRVGGCAGDFFRGGCRSPAGKRRWPWGSTRWV